VQGRFGQVHTGLRKSQVDFAVKVVSLCKHNNGGQRKRDSLTDALQEAFILRRLRHPNIVNFLGSEVKGSELFAMQEKVQGDSVTALLRRDGPFSERLAQHCTHQLLQGILYLHTYCIAHRDIKADNVLIDSAGRVKLIDFGTSVHVLDDSELATDMKGTPLFCAPEVLQRREHGLPVDIWSFGCTVLQVSDAWLLKRLIVCFLCISQTLMLLYFNVCTTIMHIPALQMVTGQPPWSAQRFRSLVALAKGVEQHRMPPMASSLSGELQRLLKSCFTWAPNDRPTARELLLHDFCRSVRCQECIHELSHDDRSNDGTCCCDDDGSYSGSRRSSDSSESSVVTQALSSDSSISDECSSDELSPSNRANYEPTTPRSDLSVATIFCHSTTVPAAYWSSSLLPVTGEPTTPEPIATNTTADAAAVSDDTCRLAVTPKLAAVRAAKSNFSSNPFAGRIRAKASVQSEPFAAGATAGGHKTGLGASALKQAVHSAATTSINPFAGRVRIALQTQPDVTASSAAAAPPAATTTTGAQTISTTIAVDGTTTTTTTITTTITTIVTTVITSNASAVDAPSSSAPS
jgi:serine/threonine protein kinase